MNKSNNKQIHRSWVSTVQKGIVCARRWPFGDVACRLMHYLVNVTAYVTVYTLVLISVIRYMTMVHGTSTARYPKWRCMPTQRGDITVQMVVAKVCLIFALRTAL